jgi:O-antigen/teichoic acid export membrane protein
MSSFRRILDLRKSAIVKSIGVYTFIGFFSKGISFLLIPLFTNPRYLSPADNGVLSLFNSSMLLLAPFVSLGMTQSILADYFKKSKEDFSNAFTTNFFVSGFMALVVICASFY